MQLSISKYLYKVFYYLSLFFVANIVAIASASIVASKQEKLTDSDIYKQAMHNILRDYIFLASATATYNHNDIIGASKKPLTLDRAKTIRENTDIITSARYSKAMLSVIEENTKTKFFITGILAPTNTGQTGRLTYKLNKDIKNLIIHATSTSSYSYFVNTINTDLYNLAQIAYLTYNNSMAFDQLVDYADLSEIITDINNQRKKIANLPISSTLLKNLLHNKIDFTLPKITSFSQKNSTEEQAQKIITQLEKSINYKLPIDPQNIYQDTKNLLLHISNIQKAIQQNPNIQDIAKYITPNTYISTSDNTMNVIEMVESNIKKRLLHIQNTNKDITANNMWLQPSYLYSTAKTDAVIGRYDSRVKGISIGAEDNNSNHDFSLGLCYSYAKSTTQSNDINTVHIDANNYIFSSYISFIFNKFIYDILLNYIRTQNHKQRIDILGYSYLASYNSNAISLECSAGKKFQLENDMIINCKFLCNLSQTNTDPYEETSSSLNYQVSPHANNKASVGVEATIYSSFYAYKARFNPECFINIKYNLLKNRKTYDLSLYSYKSTVKVSEKNKPNIKVGIGILSNIDSFNLRLDYIFKTSSNSKTHMINGNLSYYF